MTPSPVFRILCIFAHPDDESFPIGGTLAKYSHEGRAEISLYTMTRGEASRNAAYHGISGIEMGERRVVEVKEACRILGIERHFQGLFPDGRMRDLDPREMEREIERIILDIEPHLLITFEVHGGSIHPDHIAVHHAVKRVFVALKETHSWLQRLCFHALPSERIVRWPRKVAGNTSGRIHAIIDVKDWLRHDRAAILAHRSVRRDFEQYNFENWMLWDEETFSFFQESFSPPVDDLLFGLTNTPT